MARLYDEGVATVYVGDLTDVLRTLGAAVNEKTHPFWAYRSFLSIHRPRMATPGAARG